MVFCFLCTDLVLMRTRHNIVHVLVCNIFLSISCHIDMVNLGYLSRSRVASPELKSSWLGCVQVRAARKAEIVRINVLHDKLEKM